MGYSLNWPRAALRTRSHLQRSLRKEISIGTQSLITPRTNGSLPRVDGPLKVTGVAKYSSDYNLPGMLYAVPVCATIASGKITNLDTAKAQAMPGVKAVYHNGNMGRLFRAGPANGFSGILDEKRPPFEDNV